MMADSHSLQSISSASPLSSSVVKEGWLFKRGIYNSLKFCLQTINLYSQIIQISLNQFSSLTELKYVNENTEDVFSCC